jgi:hypothetical protein
MGRGSSKSGGGGGGLTPKTQVVTQDGTVLDLSDNPLVYGKADAAVTGALRNALEAQESKRLKMVTEYGLVVDANGDPIGSERHGGRSSVAIPTWTLNSDKAAAFTHNHPRGSGEAGQLGGTFSDADLDGFSREKVRTYRASAAEGTYSITKTASFNGRAFNTFQHGLQSQMEAAHNQRHSQLKADLRSGKINYKTYLQGHTNSFNKMLVDLHNGLLAGQSQYGYTYTLEART